MGYVFVRQNTAPIPVERVEDEHEEKWDFVPSFWWNNRRYHLDDDFEEIRRDPWSNVPEQITHVECGFSDPMFLEFADETHINIYKEREE